MLVYLRDDSLYISRSRLLKQEEALAELDASIDDWAAKLDRAELRRLRVRQKLLEHVAAVMALGSSSSSPVSVSPPDSALGFGYGYYPSASPAASAPTPYGAYSYASGGAMGALHPGSHTNVPAAPTTGDGTAGDGGLSRQESIRVYADSQVVSLFTDIEQAIGRMCEAC